MDSTMIYVVIGAVSIMVIFFAASRSKGNAENVFERINFWVMSSEASLVNLLSALAPWGAPIGAAASTYRHSVDHLGYSQEVALVLALVVEILGLSTINTALAFWSHNKQNINKAAQNQAPLWAPITAFSFYLFVIVLVNIIIDVAVAQDAIDGASRMVWAIIAARALLILLSIPAALVMAVRTQHNALISKLYSERTKKTAPKNDGVQRKPKSEQSTGKKSSEGVSKSKLAYNFIGNFVQKNAQLPTAGEVANAIGVARSTANPAINLFVVRNAEKLLTTNVIDEDRLDAAIEFIKRAEARKNE